MSRLDTDLRFQKCSRGSTGRTSDFYSDRCRFESCREHQGHVAQLDERSGPNAEDAGSTPVVVTNLCCILYCILFFEYFFPRLRLKDN